MSCVGQHSTFQYLMSWFTSTVYTEELQLLPPCLHQVNIPKGFRRIITSLYGWSLTFVKRHPKFCAADPASTSSRDCISPISDGEASINNVGSDGVHEINIDHASIRENGSDMHCSSERTTNYEDCSTSTASHLQSCSRRLRRSRYDASWERRRKRWRGRVDPLELSSDISITDKSNQNATPSALVASGHKCKEEKVGVKMN